MKKIFSTLFLALFGIFCVCSICFVSQTQMVNAENKLQIDAKSALLMDYDSGEVVFKTNENEKLPIASMTKIMTLLIAFDEIEEGKLALDEDITISQFAASMGGSQAFLNAGDTYKVSELLKSIIVASANDSCVAIAERIAQTVDGFVQLMNEKAKNLGMNNTNFVNCTGLPVDNHYSSGLDVGLMMRALLRHNEYYNYSKVWLYDIEHNGGRKTTLTNTNKLVRFYQGCDGGKTGYTVEAGHCLSCTAKRNDLRLISVVIGSKDSKSRFKNTSALLDYGFGSFENRKVVSCEKPLAEQISVRKGKEKVLEVIPENDVFLFSKKTDKKADYSLKVELNSYAKAPISKGEAVGKLHVIKNGNVVKSVNILSNQDIEKSAVFDNFKTIVDNWQVNA